MTTDHPAAQATPSAQGTDWKRISEALAQRVNFAISHLKAPGAGMVGKFGDDDTEAEIRPWREYFAEALEMIPGVKVDREVLELLDLPYSRRQKALGKLKAERTKEST